MDDLDTELRRAAEELQFWKDFDKWPSRRHDPGFSERVREAVRRAERRYFAVLALVDERDAQPALTGTLH